jgi:hypothetical protein
MSKRDDSDTPVTGAVSRRDFFAGAGMTAGALAALGGIVGAGVSPAALAARSKQYFSNFINFELDGAFAGRLLAAEGGEPVIVPGAQLADTKIREPSTLRYEPLSLRFGDMSAKVFDWVGKASINTATGRSAAVVAYDSLGKELYRLTMQNARLTEIMFDGLENSGEPLRVSAKILPGQSIHDLSAKTAYKGEVFKLSPLARGNFALYIQGVDTAAIKARSIDPIGLQARADGVLVPTPLRFTVPLAFATPLFSWMNDTLAGKAGPRSGELQLLSRDMTRVAASISFENLSILRMSCPIDATGTKSLQEVEVECLPTVTKFNMGDLLVK